MVSGAFDDGRRRSARTSQLHARFASAVLYLPGLHPRLTSFLTTFGEFRHASVPLQCKMTAPRPLVKGLRSCPKVEPRLHVVIDLLGEPAFSFNDEFFVVPLYRHKYWLGDRCKTKISREKLYIFGGKLPKLRLGRGEFHVAPSKQYFQS